MYVSVCWEHNSPYSVCICKYYSMSRKHASNYLCVNVCLYVGIVNHVIMQMNEIKSHKCWQICSVSRYVNSGKKNYTHKHTHTRQNSSFFCLVSQTLNVFQNLDCLSRITVHVIYIDIYIYIHTYIYWYMYIIHIYLNVYMYIYLY